MPAEGHVDSGSLVVYTAITGQYDSLRQQPEEATGDADLVAFGEGVTPGKKTGWRYRSPEGDFDEMNTLHCSLIIGLLMAALFLTPQGAAAGDRKFFNKSNAAVKKETGRSAGAVPDVAHTPPVSPAGEVPTPYPDAGPGEGGAPGSKGAKPVKKLSPGGIREILPAGKAVPLPPEISSITPLGCFVAGDRVTLGGKRFGAEQGSRKLVLSYPVNRSRTIGKPRWDNEKVTFTMPPGMPINAAGRIGIYEGRTVLADAEILFCTGDHGMPDFGGEPGSKAVIQGMRPAAGAPKLHEGWRPPSWMDDGAVEKEKSSGGFGNMVVKKPPAMVPETQTGPPLPDPRAVSITAVCAEGQRVTATVTVANTAAVPTGAQAKTAVSVIAKKVKPSKSPTPIWEDVKIVLGSHTTAAGFAGQETFTLEKAVPYFGNPQYVVRAKITVSEAEGSASNNSRGTTIHCTW